MYIIYTFICNIYIEYICISIYIYIYIHVYIMIKYLHVFIKFKNCLYVNVNLG